MQETSKLSFNIPQSNFLSLDRVTSFLIDTDLLEEIRQICVVNPSSVFFGKSLRDIKCIITDCEGLREHEVFIKYKCKAKLVIDHMKLPRSSIQEQEYSCLGDIIAAVKQYVESLAQYFFELENLDRHCHIVEPLKPTYKDDYRRILLDNRTWLHIEVTPDGLATNLYLIGQTNLWHEKLQSGLLNWDHDQDIVQNIMNVFDLEEFATPIPETLQQETESGEEGNVLTCSICLCSVLPDVPGLPQPLCQNPSCGVYYHRSCLYTWLTSVPGPRVFGVPSGNCPTCLYPITCTEKDS